MPVVFPAGLARSERSARVVAIIPSRYQSTRLPGKPLALIGAQPMVEHVYRRASEARLVDTTLVATDDDRVAEAVDRFGGSVVMTSRDHLTGTDRLAEVASVLDAEFIVNVQGDEPLISPEAIDTAIQLLMDRGHDRMSTLRRETRDESEWVNPAVVKVVVDQSGYALYFSRSHVPFTRPGSQRPPVWKHMGLYVYRREFLLTVAGLSPTPLEQSEGLEQLRVLEHGFRIATAETTIDTIGVDTPEDLDRVRRLVETGVRS